MLATEDMVDEPLAVSVSATLTASNANANAMTHRMFRRRRRSRPRNGRAIWRDWYLAVISDGV
jgi:hypothetical protein